MVLQLFLEGGPIGFKKTRGGPNQYAHSTPYGGYGITGFDIKI